MKNLLLAMTTALIAWQPCTVNAAETTLPATEKFTAISAADNVNVYFTKGAPVKVTVKAPKAILPKVKADIKDKALEIHTEKNTKLKSEEKIEVYVTAPAIKSFIAKDNADLIIQSALNSENLVLNASDNANIKAEAVTAQNAVLSASDNSNIKIHATLRAQNAAISAKDNSDVKIASIETDNLALNASDNSDVECRSVTTGTLAAHATDQADITIAGKSDNLAFTAGDQAEINADGLTAQRGTAKATDQADIKCRVKNLMSTRNDQADIHNSL